MDQKHKALANEKSSICKINFYHLQNNEAMVEFSEFFSMRSFLRLWTEQAVTIIDVHVNQTHCILWAVAQWASHGGGTEKVKTMLS